MAQANHTPRLAHTEEALTVLFCLIDDAYGLLNPHARRYESLKRLSDSEVIALALFQQLRGVESERSFLRDTERFFSHLFPGVVGLYPSSFHRRVRKLRRFLEPVRRSVLGELIGDPETLLIDSTLLSVIHPRQVCFSGSGLRWCGVGEVGNFQRLRGEAASVVLDQRRSSLLRTHPRQRRRCQACGRALGRCTRAGRRGSEEALGRPRLPQRGSARGVGRSRHPPGYRAGTASTRSKAAHRDSFREPQASLWPGRNAGDDLRRTGEEDRDEDHSLHLRVLGQPFAGSSPRANQGVVGMRSSQHTSRGSRVAVVTSSKNCDAVLEAAGIQDLFEARVDGNVAAEKKLAGKPAPETYEEAARMIGTLPEQAVVIEDAISGVQAGRTGGFGLVIGVARDDLEVLRQNGADIVVRDLAEVSLV